MPLFSLAEIEGRIAILLLALLLDAVFGEPDWLWQRLPHPVVIFGKAIGKIDKVFNQRRFTGHTRRRLGVLGIASLVGISGSAGAGINAGLDFSGTYLMLLTGDYILLITQVIFPAILLAILLAGRSLDQHIRAVAIALATSIESARTAVGMIVGRSTDHLTNAEITRAAIETGAENLSDGVFAPAIWFLIGGLPGLFIYKMTNTADSMIGYRNQRYLAFGWGAARLDDLLNYLPARLTGLMIALAGLCVTPRRGFQMAILVMCQDAGHHASPNAGWPESAMAGVIGIWLGGPRHYGNHYIQARRMNATGKEADLDDIYRSLRIMWLAIAGFALMLGFMLAYMLLRLL